MKSDEVKQTIIRLYYDEHKRPSEIALIIGKTPQYVSKIATKDKRYKAEKQYRKRKSLEKKKAYNREYNKTHVRNAKEKEALEKVTNIIMDNIVMLTNKDK